MEAQKTATAVWVKGEQWRYGRPHLSLKLIKDRDSLLLGLGPLPREFPWIILWFFVCVGLAIASIWLDWPMPAKLCALLAPEISWLLWMLFAEPGSDQRWLKAREGHSICYVATNGDDIPLTGLVARAMLGRHRVQVADVDSDASEVIVELRHVLTDKSQPREEIASYVCLNSSVVENGLPSPCTGCEVGVELEQVCARMNAWAQIQILDATSTRQ